MSVESGFSQSTCRFLANGRKRLESMTVGARRYPYSLKVWVADHCSVVIVDLNALIFILVACSAPLRWFGATDCDNICIGNTVEESADMALAHSSKASDVDVDFGVLHSGGPMLGSEVV